MLELVKIVGGISWVLGLVMWVADPTLAMLALVVAIICTIYSVSKTREQRHKELVTAQTVRPVAGASVKSPSVAERLAELDKLKASGAINNDEYQAKRQQILDSI